MSVYAVKRETKKGPRWYVRAELPGLPMIHLGTFDTEKRAKTRIKTALDDIAAGIVPARFRSEDTPSSRTLARAATEWIGVRHDLADVTKTPYERMIREWPDDLSRLDPARVTHGDVQEWVTDLSKRLTRGTIDREITVLRMVLDHEGVHPNPARDKRVKLPRNERRHHRLPTRAELEALRVALPTRVPLMLLLEWTGLRISEAAALTWGDIDIKRGRLLVQKSKTNAGTRWVERLPEAPQFPAKTADAESTRRVFPQARSFTNVLRETHERRGTVLISAHDFRHLHASRLLHDGILSPAQIAARLGHANPGVTLKVYAHVVPPD